MTTLLICLHCTGSFPTCSVLLLAGQVVERELGDVTREVGHLLAFANSGERKDAHSRGPSNLKIELGLSLGNQQERVES